MLKNILKNKIYILMTIGVFVSCVSLLTCFFIENKVYFSIMFVTNIIMNFVVTGVNLLANNEFNLKFKSVCLYLLVTLFLLLMDVTIISYSWNVMNYSILMYIKNMQLYLILYSVFVLIITFMAIYALLKNKSEHKKTAIRQNSSK